MGGQGAQGLVHWMSVMAEHMDPAMSHYMGWNQEVSFSVDKTLIFLVILLKKSGLSNVNLSNKPSFVFLPFSSCVSKRHYL